MNSTRSSVTQGPGAVSERTPTPELPHRPSRPTLSAHVAERALLALRLGLSPARIEHIGSKEVPGLGAKPIIDLMLGVDSAEAFARYVAMLAQLGYEHRGETVPGTLYNRKQGPPRATAHLCVFGGQSWEDHVLFRDFMRANPKTASAYESLKRRILVDVGPDPPAYDAAKEDFILAVPREARRLPGDVVGQADRQVRAGSARTTIRAPGDSTSRLAKVVDTVAHGPKRPWPYLSGR